MRLPEFWSQCLALLQSELSEQQFSRDIAPITVGERHGAWVLFAKTQFAANLLRTQYAQKIREAAALVAPDAPELLFQAGVGERVAMAQVPADAPINAASPANVNNDRGSLKTANDGNQAQTETASEPTPSPTPARNKSAQDILAERMSNLRPAKQSPQRQPENAASKPSAIAAEQAREAAEQRLNQTNLSPDYTFETLVEGKGNQLAANVAKSIAEKPGDSMYNPFFVYGSTGLGKTHLVQAIGNELLKNRPDAKVRYMHSDDYIRSFMKAVRNNTYDVFKQQYKQYDLLIIDDIQFIKGKDRTMEEFFYLYNHFHNEKKQLILTCDVLPAKIEGMDDRLKSRFSWGLTLELEPPELEMRVAILQKKAEAAGISIEDEAALFIANLIRSNVRELEGAFNRVSASSRFMNRPVIDMDLARTALQDIIAEKHKVITADIIIDATAKYYRIKISDILGKKRTRNIARPRQVAMSLTKELTTLSLPSIGDAFGGRDHTTVMHGVKAVAKLREEDPELAQDYEKLLILIQN